MKPEDIVKQRGSKYVINVMLQQPIADAINNGNRRLRVATGTGNYAAALTQAKHLLRRIEDAEEQVTTASASGAYHRTMEEIKKNFAVSYDHPDGTVLSHIQQIYQYFDEDHPEFLAAKDFENGTDNRPRIMTLWDVYQQALETGAINRPELVEHTIKEYGADRKIIDCTPRESLMWLRGLAETQAQTTIKNKLSRLNVVWETGVDVLGVIPPTLPNPFRGRLLKSVKTEATELENTIPASPEVIRYWLQDRPEFELYMKTCYLMGLRAFELEHIELCDDGIKITKSKTKAGIRTLPLHQEITQQEALQLTSITEADVNRWKGRIHNMKRAAKHQQALSAMNALSPRVNTHSMRKACSQNLTKNGAPVEIVSWVLGHAQAQTTTSTYIGGARPIDVMRKYVNLSSWREIIQNK